MIEIYSKKYCPFCDKTKALLDIKGISYTEIKVDEDDVARNFLLSEGHRSVPQLYKDGELLVEGGYMGLAKQPDEFFNKLKDLNDVEQS